ncbi:DNA polymerase III subunit alpha [Streptomyces melanogenes]|uniref:DNA polymerase III subunit alpha n=1 Tax=Streptomyces melanogenes TaxID=67326 RepID=UPI00167DCBBE|nr:DNA polymerase III subunit alpha [Streptomyces melanogenes]GGP80025.1 DNA-directed DNA polymerase [Streptomyces melanogenes]
MPYVHLHVASGHSARYGGSLSSDLAQRAAERGFEALALTDRDTLGGAVRHADACAREGLRPLFGADLAVSAVGAAVSAPVVRARTPVRGGAFVDESAPRIVLLARDRTGWMNLCRIISAAHSARAAAGGGQLIASFDLLQGHAEGLTVLLGPASEPVRALAAGRPDVAARLLAPWREAFGPHLRLEAVHHRRTGTGPGSLRLAARTVGLAREADLLCVLSNAVRYADPGQGPIADVLDADRLLMPVRPGRTDGGERWLKPGADMAVLAEEIARAAGLERGGAAHLLATTARTAEECRLDPAADLGLGRVHFPEERLVGAAPGTAARVLRERCESALRERGYDRTPAMRERLSSELQVISTLGWPTYFLTVAQVVDDTRALGIRVQARGSAAGSLVVHLLGISVAEPVSNGLIMERFLNLRRKSLPDIDIDVESARRIEVYRAVLERFGPERVATVSMPETYRVRHAIRAAGLALGIAPDEVGKIAKSFPHLRARDARTALRELPELRTLAQHAERYGRLWELVEGLDGLHRGVAMHPCGVLLSDDSLLQRTPVLPTATEHLPMSVFDKDDVERMGLLKLDILGVRMQSSMAYAVAEIRRATGRVLDIDDRAQVPLEDPEALQMLREGQSLSVFQLESPGARELAGRLRPETFQDLVTEISLFRPGPVQADMIRPFLEARHGKLRPRYPHPDLEPALKVTYGVVVFNEQVIEVFAVMTRTDLAMGEEARRALSDPARLPALEAWYRERSRQAGYTPAVIDEVWQLLENMGSYGFARSHATAFALATAQSAYLKAHFPAPFYAGVLEHDPGMYPKRLVLGEARRRGVPILPVDVQHSTPHYRVEALADGQLGLRIALADVHGITADEAERIAAGQPYADLGDFHTRARPSLPLAHGLARIGALDSLAHGAHRRELLLQLDELHRTRRQVAMPAQLTLATDAEVVTAAGTGLPAMSEQEQLDAELEVLGMDTSRHLMASHHELLTELGVTWAHQLREVPTGQTVLVAGAKVAIQTPPTRSKRRTIFTSLDDGSPGGVVDLVFFDDTHEHAAHVLFHRWLLVVRGQVQRRGTSISVVGEQAWSLVDLVQAHQRGGPAALRAALSDTAPSPAAPAVSDGDRTPGGRLWHASAGSAG